MEQQQWVAFADREEGAPPVVSVEAVRGEVGAGGGREALLVTYTVGGVWQGPVAGFTAVEVPQATQVTEEGAPAVPAAGLLIAVPGGAQDLQVRVLERSAVPLEVGPGLLPAPAQFVEEQFQVVHEPDPAIYGQPGPYPGRDVDVIGLRTVEEVPVAQLYVYLGQYYPGERRLEVVQSMTLEVSFAVPRDRDAAAEAGAVPTATATLIHGLELQAGSTSAAPRATGPGEQPVAEAPGPLEPALREGVLDAPSPADLAAGEARDTDAPVLKVTANYAPYLVVTTPQLVGAVFPLMAVNATARVAVTTQIVAEFPAGSLEESIRGFLGWAWANWTPVKPQFLVLAGDTDAIPMHLYATPSGSYASDNYYVDHTGDLSPEVAVARIPTSDLATMQAVCQHLADYRQLRIQGGAFENRVLISAYQGEPYESCAGQAATSFGAVYEVVKRYAKDSDRAALLAALNAGAGMVLYRGHGSKIDWSASNGLRTIDVAGLGTQTAPPFFLDICCQNGWVDDPAVETLAEALVRRRKSVAVLAASRNSWTYPNNDFTRYLTDAVLVGGLTRPAEIVKYAKTRMVVEHPADTHYTDNLVMYNTFGDPAAPVASNVEYLLGTWTTDHDGWQGMFEITSLTEFRIVKQGTESARQWTLAGVWTGADGTRCSARGTYGGFDANHLGGTPRRSDHKLDFTVQFPGNPQRFVGYIHGWSRNVMSGYTWWANIPFGWSARRLHTVLTTPTPTAPADGAVFSTFPRTTTLQWTPVPGADQYLVEVEYGYQNRWARELLTTVSAPSATFTHVGAQPGRWRVSARDSRGRAGVSGPTPWRTFRYTV